MSSPRSRTKSPVDSPEITTDTASLGRETLVAIAEDEADQARALLDRKLRGAASARQQPPPVPTPAARRTAPAPGPAAPASRAPASAAPTSRSLVGAAPNPALRPVTSAGAPVRHPPSSPGARPPQVTLDYHDLPLSGDLDSGDRDSGERVAVDYDAPMRPAVERPRSAPELIDMGVRPMGRETLAAITGDLAQELLRALSLEERAGWLQQLEGAITLEPFRFEIRGAPMLERPNDVLRREFVAVRLLHRLPVRSIDDVVRVDVGPAAEAESLLLTLWVKVPEAH